MKFKQWLETNWDDFLSHHKTGYIPSTAYARYQKDGGLAWLGNKSKHPKLLATKQYGPHTVEFRQSEEPLQYTKTDAEGNIVRGPDGRALMLSPEEMKTKNLRHTDATIVAFINDEPIGLASDEFGTAGVWVEKRYQRLGIGSDLLVMFMEDNPKFITGKSKIGQMTDAGESMTKSAYDKLSQKYGPNWFQKD
jgi:hypothetical protein